MLRRYNGCRGIRRSLTRLDPSKQFGLHATMILSAGPTPWYCPPPLVDNIRWWDNFFLKFPRPSTPEKPDVDPDHLAPLKTHGSKYSPLVSTSKIFFGCGDVLGIFPASNSKTLTSSLFFHPHSTDFHHFHLLKEDHDKQNGNNGSVLQEPMLQYHEQPHNKLRETKVCIGYHQGMKHPCQQEGLQYYS